VLIWQAGTRPECSRSVYQQQCNACALAHGMLMQRLHQMDSYESWGFGCEFISRKITAASELAVASRRPESEGTATPPSR